MWGWNVGVSESNTMVHFKGFFFWFNSEFSESKFKLSVGSQSMINCRGTVLLWIRPVNTVLVTALENFTSSLPAHCWGEFSFCGDWMCCNEMIFHDSTNPVSGISPPSICARCTQLTSSQPPPHPLQKTRFISNAVQIRDCQWSVQCLEFSPEENTLFCLMVQKHRVRRQLAASS